MSDDAVPAEKRRLILSIARPTAFVPLTRAILGRIGYAIVTETEWRETELAARAPELAIVEDRLLGELPDEAPFASLPLIVIAAPNAGAPPDDRRIVGAVPRPAGLHELFRLLQQALESPARNSLRIPTNLPARLRRGGQEWQGAVLSLSENGCLVRTPEPMRLGAELDVSFELPRTGLIETRAESAYTLVADTGLVFQATPPASRRAILDFVERQLVA